MKILPVIHHVNNFTSIKNADLAFKYGCDGVFLISHTGDDGHIPNIARDIKGLFPDKFVGINLLSKNLGEMVCQAQYKRLDGVWCDNPGISSDEVTKEAQEISEAVAPLGVNLSVFASVAFKYSSYSEPEPGIAAKNAWKLGFIPTTSGPRTGEPPSLVKIEHMRHVLGKDAPLAIASGISADNIASFKGLVTHILVSTSISQDFNNFSEEKLKELMEKI